MNFNGKPTTYTPRVTHVYRREDGEWKIVHWHGDTVPEDQEKAGGLTPVLDTLPA